MFVEGQEPAVVGLRLVDGVHGVDQLLEPAKPVMATTLHGKRYSRLIIAGREMAIESHDMVS